MQCRSRSIQCIALVSAILLLPMVVPCSEGQLFLPAELHDASLRAIDAVFNEHYREAEEIAGKVIRAYPEHPAGYFYRAVALYSWMETHMSEAREDEFIRACEQAIEKGESLADKSPDEIGARFFTAGAEGFLGMYELHHGRWLSAFKWGSKGIAILRELKQRCTAADLDYGIGSYEYWRTALSQRLWWMPKGEDRRTAGIEKLLRVRKQGVYTQSFAGEGLLQAYLNENRFPEALAMSDEMLSLYVNSRIFIFGRAQALDGLKHFDESGKIYRRILGCAGTTPSQDSTVLAYAHFKIGKIDYSRGHYDECLHEWDDMRSIGAGKDGMKELKKYFDEEAALRREAKAGQNRESGSLFRESFRNQR
jgi:tetratricopeptide (TPR) repeat protein